MAKKYYFLIFLIAILLVNCKREPLHTNPSIKDLTDFESNDGEVALGIKGGKQPYSISWSNNETDSVLKNLAAGTYFVTINDARKQVFVDTIVVNQPPWPVCVDVDENSYRTAIFGNQTWMIENLKVTKTANNTPIESYLVESNDSIEINYGRLYTWSVAMNDSISESSQGICPDGWHIPTDEDWSILIENISSFDKEIPKLDKTLALTYAGFFNNDFHNVGSSVSFWTSTQAGNNAWKRYFNKNLSKAYRYHEVKTNAISVRCIKD